MIQVINQIYLFEIFLSQRRMSETNDTEMFILKAINLLKGIGQMSRNF